jgi:hypothetical protein
MTKLSIVGKFVLATAEFLKIRVGVAARALLPSSALQRRILVDMPKIGAEICEKTHRARTKKACANRFRSWSARWAAVQVVINALLNKTAFQIRPVGTNFTG